MPWTEESHDEVTRPGMHRMGPDSTILMFGKGVRDAFRQTGCRTQGLNLVGKPL